MERGREKKEGGVGGGRGGHVHEHVNARSFVWVHVCMRAYMCPRGHEYLHVGACGCSPADACMHVCCTCGAHGADVNPQ